MNRIIWTADMVAELRKLRARGVPLYRCAERIGVGYSTAVYKARELGIAQRLNRGRIDALYAWVATEPDGGEGVCSVQLGGIHMPLIGADMDRIKSLREHAEAVHRASGYSVRLVRFSRREDLEILL
jgi:hypothetical protein